MDAGYENTTGSSNTALGNSALEHNTTASNNTAVGYQALYANTTGIGNTVLGNGAADTLTTGSYNVYIGHTSRPSAVGVNTEMVIATGTNYTGKGTNTGFIQPNTGGVYQGNNSSTWSTTSDRRLKKNIVDSTVGLSELKQLQIRNFEYRTVDEITELASTDVIEKTGVQVGVIAQELQSVLPNCVKEESTGVLSVDPDNLTWHLIKAVQELAATNDALTARITALENA